MSRPAGVHTSTLKAINAARRAHRLKVWHEPHAAVAARLAKELQKADLPLSDVVRLSNELDKALSRLPLAETTESDGGVTGDGAGSPADRAGAPDSRPDGLASGVGSGPTVGDTALP